MVKKFLATSVGILLAATWLAFPLPALAADNGSYQNDNSQCSVALDPANAGNCLLDTYIQANVKALSGVISLQRFDFVPKSTYDFTNSLGCKIHVTKANLSQGAYTCAGTSETLPLSNAGIMQAFITSGQTNLDPTKQVINIRASVDFGKADPTLITAPLTYTSALTGDIQTKGNMSPDIDVLSSNVVNYSVSPAIQAATPGSYKVCVAADFLTPDTNPCQTVTKKLNVALTVTFKLKGDPTKLANVPATTCDVGSFSWLICPVITMLNNAVQQIFQNAVIPLLVVTPFDANNPLKPLWTGLLYLADVFFVLIFFVVVFGAAFGLESYSVKKILPRLIAAAILIQFSYYIGGIIVDIGNVAGAGVTFLIATATNTPGMTVAQNVSTIGSVVDALLAGVAIAVLGIGVVGFAALSIALGVLTLLVTLVFRQIIISVLIVAAPLAFAAWVLPNTEQYFKKWLSNLTKLSLMYPMVVLIMGVAGVLAKSGITVADTASASAGSTGSGTAALVAKAITSLIPVFAFFAIPATFKAAGSLMGQVSGRLGKTGYGAASKASSAGKKSAINTKNDRLTRMAVAGNKSNNPLMSAGGRVARIGAFGIGGVAGKKSDARLYAAQAKIESEQKQGFERKYASADEASLLKAAQSGNHVERQVAIGELAKTGNIEALEKLTGQHSSGGAPILAGGLDNEDYKKAVSAHYSTLASRAPHIVRKDAYKTISADTMAGLSPDGWAALSRAATDPAVRAHLQGQRDQILANPLLAAKLGANEATARAL